MVRFGFFTVLFAALAGNVISAHGRALQDGDLPTIDEIFLTNGNLTTLAAAFNLSGLVGALCTDCNFTAFGPSNEAFAALNQEFLGKLLTSNWIAHLQNLITFHATSPSADRVLSADLEDGMVFEMVNKENITVNVDTEGVTLTSKYTEGSTVIAADILASNGVVHLVDSVLLPAFWNTSVLGLADTPEGENFSILFELLGSLNLGDMITSAGDLTVFAPTNAAFQSLGMDLLEDLKSNSTALTNILLNHVVTGINPSSSIKDGMTVKAVGGNNLTFSVSGSTSR